MTETKPDTADTLAAAGATATSREIRQQPAVWLEASAIVERHRADLDLFLAPLLADDDLRIIVTGAGTSAFAGGVVAPTVARATGRRVESIATTDLVSNPRHHLAEDVPTLLVSFARSGNSPESVAATRLTDEVLTSTWHLVITCNADGALAREHRDAEHSFVLLMPGRSDDEGFAMTSSFTSMMLSALLTFLGDAPATVAALARAAEHLIDDRWGTIRDLADDDGVRRLVFLGSGPLAALAQESALKSLELTAGGVVSYHDSSLGFRHGPKAVLDPDTLVIVYISNDPYTRSYDLDIVSELHAAIGAHRVLSVATDRAAGDGAIVLEGLAGVDDGYLAVAYVVVAQVIALSLALRIGTTPDNPFPGGDVNRVVQGVRIHDLDGVTADER
jgi:tagatose-6-phosphate ketose/aldose isomerase